MNRKGIQDRLGSTFSVLYPDFPTFNTPPHSMMLRQVIGNQDVVELSYTNFSSFYQKALKTGVPVVINWSNDKASEVFTGYVMDVTPLTQQSLYKPIIVRCIGASLALKEGGHKIWTGKTAAQIVTDIAKKFKLKPVVTENNIIFSQQSLAGHTHWEKIQELASRIGYAAHLFGTELHFHPIDKMIDLSMSVIPSFSYTETFTSPWSNVLSHTLDYFKPTTGDYFSHVNNRRAEKVVTVVDPITGKLTTHSNKPNGVGKNLRADTKAPLFKEVLSTVVTGTAKMAQALADSHAQLSKFSIHAKCKGQGDPRVAPHRTIEINGTGEQTDGFWVVKEATHILSVDGQYRVEFSCMMDGTGRNKESVFRPSQAGIVPVRNLNYAVTTGALRKPTSVKLNAKSPLISQNNAGWNVTPRRWEGK